METPPVVDPPVVAWSILFCGLVVGLPPVVVDLSPAAVFEPEADLSDLPSKAAIFLSTKAFSVSDNES
jgi:hypothetical protein